MYLPDHFAETRLPEIHRIVHDHPLGMLVATTPGGLDANHVPFELDPAQGPHGTLQAHVARANPLATELAGGADVLVVFRGVQGYISPNWYSTKQETHRHVPTWNYEAVHARGRLRLVDDERFLRGLLAKLTRRHEAGEPAPWRMGQAPADYLERMLGMVVGIEVEVTRWEAKRKLSQNRDARDFDGAVQALRERGREDLADAMVRGVGHIPAQRGDA